MRGLLDPDGAPLNGAYLFIPFDRPVKLGTSQEMAVVNAVLNLETRQPEVAIAGVRSMRVDPRSQRQVLLEVDALLADGAAIAFGRCVIRSANGKELPPCEVKLKTPWTPFAVAFAHEAVHSDLGGGSVTEELLAMASDTRVYREFLLWDPAIALAPTDLIRSANRLTLAMRNSGPFGYPHAGLLPRPGVEDALRRAGKEPARSFKDLLFKPHFYGDYNPKGGDAGTEVLESYYRRISGNAADQGRLKYDQHTLKLFDSALDHGFTDDQILRIVDALKLKPVPIGAR